MQRLISYTTVSIAHYQLLLSYQLACYEHVLVLVLVLVLALALALALDVQQTVQKAE